MRPIRLTLQAFGPFAGTETIYFDQASHSGLFGIYGPTGAGKTSIFDGLCFALFGQSSGASRDGKDFRSDHADLDTLTQVELVFDLGPKRYVIKRIPAQERAAKRGGRTTQQSHEAYFFDATGMDVSQINDNTQGKVLAEKKTSQVDKLVPEILGYSASQFRQIILLPQGQFRQILDANTKDRAAILEQLFDVSHFKRFQENLKEKAKDSSAQIKEATTRRDDRLSQSGYASIEELAGAINAGNIMLDQAKMAVEKSKIAHSKAREKCEHAKMINGRFDELTKAQTELAHLHARQPEIDDLQLQLDSANRAKTLLGLETALSQSKLDHQQAITRHAEATHTESNAKQGHQQALSILETLQDQQASMKALETRLQYLKSLQDIAASTLSLKANVETCYKVLNSAQLKQDALQKNIDETKLKLEEQKKEAGLALQRERDIAKLEKQLDSIKADLAALQIYATQKLEFDKLNQQLTSTSDHHKAATSAQTNAQTHFDKAQADLSHIQALHLAANLKNGENCPVCGSLEHPNLASGDRSSKGLNEAFEKAKKTLEIANADEREANNRLISLREKTYAAQKLLDGLTPSSKNKVDLENEKNQCTKTLSALKAAPSHEDISKLILALETALTDQNTTLQTGQQTLQSALSAYEIAKSRYEDTLTNLPPEYRDTSLLSREIVDLDKQLKGHAEQLEKAQKNERSSLTHYEGCKASTLEKNESLERALKRLNGDKTNFETALRDAKFTADTFLNAKSILQRSDTLLQQIDAYKTALIAVKAQIKQAEEFTKNHKLQDIETLQSNLNAASKDLETKTEALSTAQHNLAHLRNTRDAIDQASKEVDRLNEKFGPLGGLADLMDGKNAYRLKLADFAIAAMYDDVLDAANIRLTPMTSGRFELRRDTSAASGKGSQGLDTLVYDAHTDTHRRSSSLSGGEGFLASLALALGLSDVVQAQAGGVRLESLFIDEGFGTLGSETLDLALDTLQELASNNRLVGIISHVEDVKRAIPNGFIIEKSKNGSRITQRNSTL
ncbi:AAA family ATPase [Hirschia litorea]|uniref:AAA family ATPase n=1 Tax=Hirschia litorea TaxID=1199156 RepID=A0ABW2IM91_9PROT